MLRPCRMADPDHLDRLTEAEVRLLLSTALMTLEQDGSGCCFIQYEDEPGSWWLVACRDVQRGVNDLSRLQPQGNA